MFFQVGKKKVSILVVLGGIAGVLLVLLILKDNDILFPSNEVVEFYFKEDGVNYEVRYDIDTQVTWLYKNKVKEEVIHTIPKTPIPALTLEELSFNEKPINLIETKQEISDLTWEASFKESSNYVKYLLSEGYLLEREVGTSQFVDLIVSKNGNLKRVLIFNTTIMVGDLVDDKNLSTVDKYLESLKK